MPVSSHVRVAIIGSGFGGIGTAIRLKQSGIADFVIFERASDVGGVWRDNSYPGAACDVPSHLYSFSFAPNPDWSHHFSPQPEIWEYLRRCVQQFSLQPHLRLNHEVRSARWNDKKLYWEIATSQGDYTASVLVMATGALSEPNLPALPGLENFKGVTFHSARWNHSFDLRGRNVAVIGTGASAIQFVPAIQPGVAKLYLFQRTPAWVLPRGDHAIDESQQQKFRRFPLAQKFQRAKIYLQLERDGIGFRRPELMKIAEKAALEHLQKQVTDPDLRAKLMPNYTIGCKRILISDNYYPAVTQPNVELITSGVGELRAHSIVGNDGVERPLDAIIFGTGFHVTDFPFAAHVWGRGGVNLGECWAESPKAHVGTTVAGFPNFFILQGPNTGSQMKNITKFF